jgi:hypothetical protein
MQRFALATLLCAACGDDNGMQNPPQIDAPDIDAAPMPDAPPPDAAIDAPKFISQPAGTLHEHEPMIAANGSTVVGAWIGYYSNITTNGYAISHDDGMTWARPQQIDSPGARGSGDPVISADAAGNFYLTWIGFLRDSQGNATDIHVYSSTMPAGSTAFGTPVEVTDVTTAGHVDKNWVTVLGDGTVLVTWADLNPAAYGLWSAVSTDQGATFTRHRIFSGSYRNLLFPCADPASASSPVYAVASSGSGGVFIYKSVDDGTTWGAAGANLVSGGTVFQDSTCAVAAPNDVWVLYPFGAMPTQPGFTTPADSVRLAHSTDGAATWATKITISDTNSPDSYLLPQMARSASGHLHAVWYQGPVNGAATFTHAVSTDDGATWMRTAVRMSGTFITDRASPSWLGDYIGIFAAGTGIYVDYGDNSAANQRDHINFVRFMQ